MAAGADDVLPERAERALREGLGTHVGRRARVLGVGSDHTALLVDDDLVVRTGYRPYERLPSVEAALLELLRANGLPVPEVVLHDDDARVLVHRFVPGRPVHEHDDPDLRRLGHQLLEVVDALHALTPEAASLAWGTPDTPAAWQHDALRAWRAVADRAPASAAALVEPFLQERLEWPEEEDEERLCHADLGSEHVLVAGDGATVTGIIDWSDAWVTDPARDLGRIWRDLGPDVARRIRDGLSSGVVLSDEHIRAYAGWAAVEDVAYGLGPGPRAYAERALANLERTLAPVG